MNGKSYHLDDQTKLAEFAGQKVKIEGKMNSKTKSIHVESITGA